MYDSEKQFCLRNTLKIHFSSSVCSLTSMDCLGTCSTRCLQWKLKSFKLICCYCSDNTGDITRNHKGVLLRLQALMFCGNQFWCIFNMSSKMASEGDLNAIVKEVSYLCIGLIMCCKNFLVVLSEILKVNQMYVITSEICF